MLGTVGGPECQEVMIRILEQAATASGDEPRVALLGQDHAQKL